MKIVIFLAVVFLYGCSSIAPYEHSKGTHANAVQSYLDASRPVILKPHCGGQVEVRFSVAPSGDVESISVSGGCKKTRTHAASVVEDAAPFPPHTENEAISYTVLVLY